jgi:polysaccharide biosynthesis transport protein
MLQVTNSPPLEIDSPTETSPRDLVHWALGIARRQFAIITSIALTVTSLGALYALTAPPTYTADVTILIDPRRVQLFQGAMLNESAIDSSALEGQVELVKSEPVALAAIKQLHLSEDAEFLKSDAGLAGTLRSALHYFTGAEPNKPPSASEAPRIALGLISKNLTVNRVGNSYNLAIKYRATNPEQAAQIANAIAESYISEQLEGKYESTKRAAGWLQDRIEELNQKRALAERAVVDFKQEKNMIAAGGKLINEQQIAEINSNLVSARQKASEEKARLDRIDVIIRDDAANATTDGTVADSLNNPIVQQLRTRYLELVNRETNWSRKYGANHLAVVNLRNQIRDVRVSVLEELKRLRESYLSAYEIAKQQVRALEDRLAEAVSQSQGANQAQVALRELESSAQTYRTMHDNFLQRYSESIQQKSFPISDARIVARASAPLSKSGPKTALILVITAAGGLVLGVASAIGREMMNASLLTRTQIESALQMPCISVVPSFDSGKQRPLRNAKSSRRDRCLDDTIDNRRLISRNPDVFWAVIEAPFSRFSEAIRSIRLAIDLNNGAANGSQVIGFTSSLPNEGKSTIVASLALLMAQAGSRVILVDCDLRNPSLTRKFALGADVGILDVLGGRVFWKDAVLTDPSTRLTFLPSELKMRVAHSSDILAADATKELFRALRTEYDYILVDLSPLMPIVDVRATTGFVDSYICVTEWGRTKVDALRHSFRDAHNIHQNLLGVVLNKADLDQLSSYDPVGGNYYRNRYYSQYGLTD